jgi:hypothetical protein
MLFRFHSVQYIILCAVFVTSSFLFASCGSDADHQQQDTTALATPAAPETPPFSIDLLPGYKIEKQVGPDFTVYYFQPTDTSQSFNEGGIYFGAAPDTSSPRTQSYTKREFRDVFMGDTAEWREFTTDTYVQREVYVEKNPNEKIHSWCYSNDPAMMEKLYAMIQSIRPQ